MEKFWKIFVIVVLTAVCIYAVSIESDIVELKKLELLLNASV